MTRPPILVVDDEEEILHSLRALLRMAFQVHTASSGAEALQILKQHPVHVVMTDQRMPEITGVELLQRVQGEWPDAIRMIFTGYSDIKAVIEAVNQGHIFRYITKPWDPEELQAVLRQACEEYARIVERRQLLAELEEHLAQWLQLAEALETGGSGPSVRPGSPTGDGKEQAAALSASGRCFLDRIRKAVGRTE
jgi:DNA-binding NtrC family response regulator